MSIISLEEYTRLNEAVIGLRRLATKEDLKQLSEEEFNNLIRFLLIQSVGQDGLYESKNIIKDLLLESNLVDESQFTDSINESLNEDWDDDASAAVMATGAGVVAGAASLASYINFLFKKKKIRKAWEEVRDLKKEQSDLELKDFEMKRDLKAKKEKDLKALEPELTVDQYKEEKQKITDKRENFKEELATKKENLKNYDKDAEAKLEKAKEKVNAAKKKLFALDSENFSDPDAEESKPEAKPESKPEAKPESKPEAKPEAKPETEAKPKTESLKEADDGSGDKGPMGELQIAQKKVEEVPSDEDVRSKAKEGKGKAAVEKNKKVRDKAKAEVNKVKAKIKTATKTRDNMQKEVEKYSDPEKGKQAIKDEIADVKDKIENQIPTEFEELKAKIEPDPALATKKTEVEDNYKDEVEKQKDTITQAKDALKKNVEDATQAADNVSGTSGGGQEAKTIANKTLGFSKSFANKVKAEHDMDIAQHQKANRSKMGIDTDDIDAKITQTKSRISNADKEMDNKEASVDGTEDEIKQAKMGVKNHPSQNTEEYETSSDKDSKNKNESLSFREKFNMALKESQRKELIPEEDEEKKGKDKKDVSDKPKPFVKKEKEKKIEGDTDGDGTLDPSEKEKQRRKESEESNKSNPLVGKKVVLRNMRDIDKGNLEGAKGEVVHVFDENEREPEGDLPRRTGEPEVYKIKLDNPKDPMYPDINVQKEFFEEAKDKEKAEESIANKFRNALNEAKKR